MSPSDGIIFWLFVLMGILGIAVVMFVPVCAIWYDLKDRRDRQKHERLMTEEFLLRRLNR